MCIPINFLRCYIITCIGITLIAGLTFIRISVFGYQHSDLWLSDTSSTKNSITIGVLLINVLIIGASIVGAFGVVKGKPRLICLFVMLAGVFCLCMAAMGVYTLVGPQQILPQDCRNNSLEWIQNISKLYSASGSLCNQGCPCNFSSFDSLHPFMQSQIRSYYSSLEGPDIQLQTCQSFQSLSLVDSIPNVDTLLYSLGTVQKYFLCTGWCDGDDYHGEYFVYKFSDVNYTPQPNGYCYHQLRDWMLKWSNVIAYSCFGMTAVLGFVFFCNMCICCHPARKNKRVMERLYDEGRQINYQYHGGI